MAKIYANLILKGLKALDSVPTSLKSEVAKVLALSGDEAK